jgi:phenylacetate-coenzyme A ligase PaaK-like adenylate-forming protein
VPPTTKADLRAAGLDAILAHGSDRRALESAFTSGTTGEPFETCLSKAEFGLRKMHQLRPLLVNGLRPRDRIAALGPFRSMSHTLHQRLGLHRLRRIPMSLPVEEQIAELRAFEPTVLWA